MKVIEGGIFSDNRGIIKHVNDFDFKDVKRFYTIYHPKTETIRAWQGHKVETKYFYVIQGYFKLQWIRIDDWNQPNSGLFPESLHLTAHESQIIKIEGGHVNGFKAVEPNSIMMIFSDKSLEASKEDDYRWGVEYFENAVW